jgi:hypothetical protein
MKGRVFLNAQLSGDRISFPVTIVELLDGRSYWRKVLIEFEKELGRGTVRTMTVAIGDFMSDPETGKALTATSIARTLRAERKSRAARTKSKPSARR